MILLIEELSDIWSLTVVFGFGSVERNIITFLYLSMSDRAQIRATRFAFAVEVTACYEDLAEFQGNSAWLSPDVFFWDESVFALRWHVESRTILAVQDGCQVCEYNLDLPSGSRFEQLWLKLEPSTKIQLPTWIVELMQSLILQSVTR